MPVSFNPSELIAFLIASTFDLPEPELFISPNIFDII